MNEDNFTIRKEDDRSATTACKGCPLTTIPAEFWLRFSKPSFGKRHPLLFCFLLLLIFGIGFGAAKWLSRVGNVGDKIALVSVKGPIMEVGPTLDWLTKIANNPNVKGLLLRIDSPGGGAAASQEIYAALAAISQKMPVAASMGATAASGGLMVAMAAQRVFANPSTVTGSIGVRMDIPQLQGLMDKIGIGQETLVTAPYKDAASLFRPVSPADREYLQGVIENMHEQFVDIVAAGRKMSHEKAASLANGKIYTGQEALSLGLIDELGGQTAAHKWLADQSGVSITKPLLKMSGNGNRLFEKLLSMSALAGFSGLDIVQDLRDKISSPAFLY